MPAAYPRDATIAVVGDGFGSLLVYATAVYLGFGRDEVTVHGTSANPVGTYEGFANNLGQTVLRSESEGHFLPADWPTFAQLNAWSHRSPAPLARSIRRRYNPGVAEILTEAHVVGRELGWEQARVPHRVGWLQRAEGPPAHFVLYDEEARYLGRTRRPRPRPRPARLPARARRGPPRPGSTTTTAARPSTASTASSGPEPPPRAAVAAGTRRRGERRLGRGVGRRWPGRRVDGRRRRGRVRPGRRGGRVLTGDRRRGRALGKCGAAGGRHGRAAAVLGRRRSGGAVARPGHRAVVLGRRRHGRLGAADLQHGFPHVDAVAGRQRGRPVDAPAVDARAVGRAEVLDAKAAVGAGHHGVAA